MAYYDIKEIKFKLKQGGTTKQSSYAGSLDLKRPQSEFEAQQQAMRWLARNYPKWEVVDLKISFK